MAIDRTDCEARGYLYVHDELPDLSKTTFSDSSQGHIYFDGYEEVCEQHSDCLKKMLNLAM